MDEEDALYGLPREEFVPQRDALAKRLRKEGDRDAADRIKRLRKPTVAAWAVNQVMRTQPAAARELAAAGEALREAQAALLEGTGSGDDLRAAGERERAAVGELVRAARGLLSDSGNTLTESVVQDVGETLHAATVDDEAREAVLAGSLDRERKASGLGGDLGVMAAAPPRPVTRGAARRGAEVEPSRAEAARDELRAARAAAKQAAEAASKAEREHARAEVRLEAAEEAFAVAKQGRDDARAAERAARRTRDQAAKERNRRQAALEALEVND